MKACKLKIISSNIIGDIDTPKIQYISKNKRINFNLLNDKIKDKDEKINCLEEKIKVQDKILSNEVEEKMVKNIQLEELIKYELINNNNNTNNVNNDLNNIKVEENKIIEEEENNQIMEDNGKKEENIKMENNNIDINDLCTISNNFLYKEDGNNLNINNNNKSNDLNNNSISFLNNNNYNYNYSNNVMNTSYYPYSIERKKREINISLRSIFKNRDKKQQYMRRTLSCMTNKNKKTIVKNKITVNNLSKKNNKNIDKKNNNKNTSLNKSGRVLNIDINKSFCMNNNKNKQNNNNKLKNKSKCKNSNNSTNSKNSKRTLKEHKNNLKNMSIKKYNKDESNSSSFISWNIIEKRDLFIEHNINYKLLMDDLLIKQCQLVQEKEKIIHKYEEKLKPLKEINKKYINDNNEELGREDELKGELTVLKLQYEKLFKQLNKENNNNNYNYMKKYEENTLQEQNQNKIYQDIFKKKLAEINQEFKDLNNTLNKGEILLITQPNYLKKLSDKDINNIILMLKGLFVSLHILDTDKIVDFIWKYDKKIQTIYFLVKELINFFKLESNVESLLINFFYSFCKNYNYMNINAFKKLFKEKIGKIQIYNKYIYITKLLNFHRSEIVRLLQVIKEKDVFNLGFIKYEKFIRALQNIGLYFHSDNSESDNFLEFFFFCMKKNRSLDLNISNKNSQNYKNEIKYSLFDLFYESLNDFIDEYQFNQVKNPFKLIRQFMEKKKINNAEYLLKPLLNNKYILKINNVEYIDIIVLNKYLRKIGIIQKTDKISVSVFEEELIDKQKFIDDIYNYDLNVKEEDNNFEKIKKKADNLIDDIFGSIS